MAYTQLQHDALQAAIAQGATTVTYGDKTITYRSLKEMQQILDMMKSALSPSTKPVRRKYAECTKGIFTSTRC